VLHVCTQQLCTVHVLAAVILYITIVVNLNKCIKLATDAKYNQPNGMLQHLLCKIRLAIV